MLKKKIVITYRSRMSTGPFLGTRLGTCGRLDENGVLLSLSQEGFGKWLRDQVKLTDALECLETH